MWEFASLITKYLSSKGRWWSIWWLFIGFCIATGLTIWVFIVVQQLLNFSGVSLLQKETLLAQVISLMGWFFVGAFFMVLMWMSSDQKRIERSMTDAIVNAFAKENSAMTWESIQSVLVKKGYSANSFHPHDYLEGSKSRSESNWILKKEKDGNAFTSKYTLNALWISLRGGK